MLDFSHVATPYGNADVQVFTANAGFLTWLKPRGKTIANILCVGSGAGGGGAFQAASGTRGGGGGGGSSGVSRLLIPIHLLPDVLYLQVPFGGAGGVASATPTPGSAGGITYIMIYPNGTATNTILQAGNSNAGGGGAGAAGTGGSAGTAGGAATLAGNPLAGLGQFTALAGQVGIIGGASLQAGPQTIPVTGIVTMGGGGGSGANASDVAGGIITTIAGSWLSERAPVGAPAGTNNGSNGFLTAPLWFSFCGLGGAASAAGNGGNGGAGGPGSGGGGGGTGIVTAGTGNGGRGGDGMVIITCW